MDASKIMSEITIAEVKQHLRITSNADNDLLGQKLAAAEDHVARFIGGPLVVSDAMPAGVREAVLQQTAFLFDGTPVDLSGLLAPYRVWSF